MQWCEQWLRGLGEVVSASSWIKNTDLEEIMKTKGIRKTVQNVFICFVAVLLLLVANVAMSAPVCSWPSATFGVCVDDGGNRYCVSCPEGTQSAACSRVSCSDNGSNQVTTQPSRSALESQIIDFYNNRGEWAGVFRIGHIERLRVDSVSGTRAIASVRYRYIPIPGNYKKRTDTGYDQRTFVFNKNGPLWEVVSMGGYMSAQF